MLPAGQHSQPQPPPPPPSRVSEQTEQRPSFGDYPEPGLPRLFPACDLFPRVSIADAIVAIWEKCGTDSDGQRFKDMYLWKKHERANMNYKSDAVCVRAHQYLAWRALARDAGDDAGDACTATSLKNSKLPASAATGSKFEKAAALAKSFVER